MLVRLKFKDDSPIESNPELDLGGDFAHMMGIDHPYDDVARMYFILHSDHESGNVSAHTIHLVASALSDCYYALSAGINGLAGPLHGLANEEVLRWTQAFIEKLGGEPNPHRVFTPTAVISVRGTIFDVAVNEYETTVVSVSEGLVGVRHRLLPARA